MSTTPIVVPVSSPEPTIAELRAMVADPEVAPVVKAEPAVEGKEAEPEVEKTEPDKGKARDASGKFVKAGDPGTEEIQEPEKTVEDDPLPANVQKRIAKEVEKQARIDREIAEHVSRTKAKQAELEKIKVAAATGSEPATNPEAISAEDEEPVEPQFGTEGQTWGQYQEELKAWRKSHDSWLLAKAERVADEKWIERQRQEKFDRTIAEAEKAHGKDFDTMRQRVVENTPEGLQVEIGLLEDWPSMVAFIGKPDNASEMERLATLYARNPSAAVRELGRLEDRLNNTVSKEPEKVKEKPVVLPEPPARVGGGAAATPKVNLEKADMRTFKREIQTLLER